MIDTLYYHSTIWQYIAISPICICILTLSDVALLPFVSVFKSYVSLSVFMWWWYVCVCMCVCVCLCVCVCIPHLHHFYQYSLSGVYLSTFAYSRRFSFFFFLLIDFVWWPHGRLWREHFWNLRLRITGKCIFPGFFVEFYSFKVSRRVLRKSWLET